MGAISHQENRRHNI